MLVAEIGDPDTPCDTGAALFVATGTDPYALLVQGAQVVSAHIGVGRLRRHKALLEVADALGWCTWDAFYKEVTPDKVLQGLHCHLLPGGVRRLQLMR